MPDEIETILRLVAEAKLSPEEAAPIIEALTRAQAAEVSNADDPDDRPQDRLERHARRADRHIARAHRRFDRALDRAHARAADIEERFFGSGRGPQLRVRVTERGRQVVNLRIPIGFVDAALNFVPGLGGDQADRIREAVRSGVTGPILDVEEPDGAGSVLISVE